MKIIKLICIFFVTNLMLNSACKQKLRDKDELVIFVAASLGDVTKAMVDSFKLKYKCTVKTNIASSGTLARQITQGADADIFLSANKLWVNYLDSLAYLKHGKKVPLTENELVLISNNRVNTNEVSINSSFKLSDLIGNQGLAIGNPSHVPLGQYTQQCFKHYGWENILRDNVITANNARSTLMLVEMGEIPFGIVYRSDAIKSDKVKVLGTFPAESHSPIEYTACTLSNKKLSQAFIDFTQSKTAQSIYIKYGIKP